MRPRVFSSACLLAGAFCGLVEPGCSLMQNSKSGGASHADRPESVSLRSTSGAAAPRQEETTDTSPVSRLRVNEETVEAAELWRELHEELRRKAQSLSPGTYRDYVARRAQELIRNRVYEMLFYQQAASRLSPEMEERVDTYVEAEIRKTVTMEFGGRRRAYERALEAKGQTLEGLRNKLRRDVVIQAYLEGEVRSKIDEPSRKDLVEAFQNDAETLEDLRRPPRRRMSLIDVRVRSQPVAGAGAGAGATDPAPERLGTAHARILAARDALNNGDEFAGVARRCSDGIHAEEGGAWGWITRGSVRERFEPAVEALFLLGLGEVTGVIKARDGFFLVRCDEIDPGVEPDFQTVQPQLVQRLFRHAYDAEIRKLTQTLRQRAHIEPVNLGRFHVAVVRAALEIHSPGLP